VATFAARKDIPNVLSTCASSLRLVFFLTLPSIFFLTIASKPIISTLYQHGLFTYQDTVFTSQALIFYAFGLFAYASVRVIAPVFYSLGDTKTPVKVSVLAVTVNIALNLAFMRPLSFRGLALATSLSAMINMFVLMSLLRRRVGPLDIAGLTASFLKILSGSAVMGVVLFVAQKWYPINLETSALLPKAVYLLILFSLAAGSYLGLAVALKVRELQLVLGIFKKKR
jgi:putative peptidoglycan lipid II flippase